MIQEVFPKESTQELASYLEGGSRSVYAGFDPTSESLHVGNLLVLMSLLHFQRGGHKVICLIGSATAKIGDPSGKDSERDILPEKLIEKNVRGIRNDIERIFSNHQKYFKSEKSQWNPPTILNNGEWFKSLNVLDFFAKVGRHFRVGRMMSRSNIKTRLNSGLGFSEFSYQVFQGYDWLHLYESLDCRLQIGGSDQMGNIYGGQELISRITRDGSVYGITLPLILDESGNKFGKSQGNAVWLNSEKTSSFDLYQYFLRRSDVEAKRLLPLYSLRSLKEIEDILKSKDLSKRSAQKTLAHDVTLLVHGPEGLKKALTTTSVLYESDLNVLRSLNISEIREIFVDRPYIRLLASPGLTIRELAMKIGCFKTAKDAERIIQAGGFYVNHSQIKNSDEILLKHVHILENDCTLVRVGKKNYYIVEWTF